MPPHPKRKHSKGRRDRRRAHHALAPAALVACANCGEMRPQHTVCPNCGHYEVREVIVKTPPAASGGAYLAGSIHCRYCGQFHSLGEHGFVALEEMSAGGPLWRPNR